METVEAASAPRLPWSLGQTGAALCSPKPLGHTFPNKASLLPHKDEQTSNQGEEIPCAAFYPLISRVARKEGEAFNMDRQKN